MFFYVSASYKLVEYYEPDDDTFQNLASNRNLILQKH